MAATTKGPKPARGIGGAGAIGSGLALFLAVLTVLAVRLSAGQDPVAHAHKIVIPQVVVQRKVYVKHEVVQLPPTAPPQAAVTESSPSVSSYPAYQSYSAPVTRTSGVP